MSKHSAACCSIPPVIYKGYEPKGSYKTIDGIKSYITGKENATTGIFVVYDIFGFFPQTLQGADILATSDKDHQYQVFVPDFFDGTPADIAWYPPDTKEKGEKLGAWFTTRGPPMGVEKVTPILDGYRKTYPNIKTWVAIGFCWGGKVISLSSSAGTPWKAAAQSSPAMVDPDDATKVSIPMMMLASKEEKKEDVEQYGKNLTVPKQVEFYDEIHGFMTARSDLSEERGRAAYEKGYKTVLEFFAQYA
ncbi:MAG: hypothetical protein M1818_002198 [Claussenomyces sp. TS43310]|nr:MAG: hypothetical protein M1818_002198 [Claussenomyces sp. TS43310]